MGRRVKILNELLTDDSLPCLTQRVLARLGGWEVLVGCAMLNKTGRATARPVLARLLSRWPTPERMAAAPAAALEPVIRECGLWRRRARALHDISAAWRDGRRPPGMPWCGRYAEESYSIFVTGDFPDGATPLDGELRQFVAYSRRGTKR